MPTESPQSPILNPQSVPTHVGIILDGNRRWAKAKGLPTMEGHREGAEVFKEIALGAFDRGVKYLSAFVFSSENWSRTEEEVGYLMKLVTKAVENYLDTFHKAGIKIVILGRKTDIPKNVARAIARTEEKTKDNTKGTLALCFNYGGEDELIDVYKKALEKRIAPEDMSKDVLHSLLYEGDMIPPVDLVIRTSGEQRTSGFMLLRAAYSELYFAQKLWPDFTLQDFQDALDWYGTRKRRFGT
ncbi:MAG: polyprenyl diphosphate synthase [Candidatus Saccharibacteria bacterium]|nr:polyprenyl diphosphate synthase [Candidatus Saccharibacteria bacterium]